MSALKNVRKLMSALCMVVFLMMGLILTGCENQNDNATTHPPNRPYYAAPRPPRSAPNAPQPPPARHPDGTVG